MNLFMLVGIDLLFSVLLGLLVFFLTWNRLCARLETARRGATGAEICAAETESGTADRVRRDTVRKKEGCDAGRIGQTARTLKKRGLSPEQIARKLQVSTGEVQMALALSELGKVPEPAGSLATTANEPDRNTAHPQ